MFDLLVQLMFVPIRCVDGVDINNEPEDLVRTIRLLAWHNNIARA